MRLFDAMKAKHLKRALGQTQEQIDEFDRALSGARVVHHLEVYPGAPHSFFDRTFAEHGEACDDAWRRVLGFVRSGDVAARA